VISYSTFPTIHLGSLTFYTFGLCVAVGVLLGAYVTSKRNARFGISTEATQSMVMWLVVAGLVGARLAWVATNWSQIHSPIDVIAVWKGGMQFSGGFIAALAIAPWATRRLKVGDTPRMALLDSAAVGLAVGQWLGRLGCISVGEHLGGPTTFFLGWKYLGGTTREPGYIVGQTYHNTAVYEFLWLIPVIGLLLWLDRRSNRAHLAHGTLIGAFIVMNTAARFGTDFFRIHDKTLAGLTGAQYMCLALFPVGVWVLIRIRRNRVGKAAVIVPEG